MTTTNYNHRRSGTAQSDLTEEEMAKKAAYTRLRNAADRLLTNLGEWENWLDTLKYCDASQRLAAGKKVEEFGRAAQASAEELLEAIWPIWPNRDDRHIDALEALSDSFNTETVRSVRRAARLLKSQAKSFLSNDQRGRKIGSVQSDPKKDARIYRDWQHSGLTKRKFAEEKGEDFGEIKAAIDRHTHRLKK